MPQRPAPTANTPGAVELHARLMAELEMACGYLGVSEFELCRRAGYNEAHMAEIRGRGKHTGKIQFPSFQFLNAIEQAWGVRFQVTLVPHEAEYHGNAHLDRSNRVDAVSR